MFAYEKQPIKTVLIWLLKAFAGGVISLAVLSVIAFFYNYSGIHITNPESSTQVDKNIIGDEYRSELSEFLGSIKSVSDKYNVTPIIFYAPNEHLSEDGDLILETNEEYLEVYRNTCINHGIIFIDMSESFNRLYSKEKTLAHGFPNTAVGVGHLNKHGHKVIAETLVSEIYKTEVR